MEMMPSHEVCSHLAEGLARFPVELALLPWSAAVATNGRQGCGPVFLSPLRVSKITARDD